MTKKKKKKLNKRLTYLMSVLAILAAGAMAVMIFTSGGEETALTPEQTTQEEMPDTVGYDSHVVSQTELSYPLLPTDIDGVLMNINPSGAFGFYEYIADNGSGKAEIVPCEDVKTLDVEATCSSQKIPATIYYVERDGRITGGGLFTTAISDADVRLYEYAFFKLVSMPEGYGEDDAMLLVDFDKGDFAVCDKTYSEAFGCKLSNGDTQRLTSENGRLVDENGRMRTDWNVLTDHFLKNCGGDKYYISGRNYNLNHMSIESDIIMCPDTSKTKPTLVVKGICGTYLSRTDDGLVYLKQTDSGINVVKNTGGTESVTLTLPGTPAGYLTYSDWMLEKSTMTLTNLLTGKQSQIKSAVKQPTAFSVSPDGKAAVLFKADGEQQTLSHYDLIANTESVSVQGGLFAEQYPFVLWVTDSEYIIHRVTDGKLSCSVCSL